MKELSKEELIKLPQDELVKELSKKYFVQLVQGRRIDVLTDTKEELLHIINRYSLSFIAVVKLEDCIRGVLYFDEQGEK